ncbi:MAG: hypothetical protein GXP26_04050 [Planctomycetes bacterium]|nr:hypothetical protein [Planctomycetota bacterium]
MPITAYLLNSAAACPAKGPSQPPKNGYFYGLLDVAGRQKVRPRHNGRIISDDHLSVNEYHMNGKVMVAAGGSCD